MPTDSSQPTSINLLKRERLRDAGVERFRKLAGTASAIAKLLKRYNRRSLDEFVRIVHEDDVDLKLATALKVEHAQLDKRAASLAQRIRDAKSQAFWVATAQQHESMQAIWDVLKNETDLLKEDQESYDQRYISYRIGRIRKNLLAGYQENRLRTLKKTCKKLKGQMHRQQLQSKLDHFAWRLDALKANFESLLPESLWTEWEAISRGLEECTRQLEAVPKTKLPISNSNAKIA